MSRGEGGRGIVALGLDDASGVVVVSRFGALGVVVSRVSLYRGCCCNEGVVGTRVLLYRGLARWVLL